MGKTPRRRSASRCATSKDERVGRVPFPALFLAFALVSLLVYRGAISGPFVSDDVPYIVDNASSLPITKSWSAWALGARSSSTVPSRNVCVFMAILPSL